MLRLSCMNEALSLSPHKNGASSAKKKSQYWPVLVCAKRGRMMQRNPNKQTKKQKAQNIHDCGKESAGSLPHKILPTARSSPSLHHAKVPKNEIDQKLCLALIVALLISQSPRYTRVISTSSIFSAGRRWCCVGGGGAARTCNSQNQPVTTTKRPNSIRNPSHCLHRPPGSPLQMMHTNRLCILWIQLQGSPLQPSGIFLMAWHRFSLQGAIPHLFCLCPWISQDVNLGKTHHMLNLMVLLPGISVQWQLRECFAASDSLVFHQSLTTAIHTQNLMLFSHSATSLKLFLLLTEITFSASRVFRTPFQNTPDLLRKT